MNANHRHDDRALKVLELLIADPHRSFRNAAIFSLGGSEKANEAELKMLGRRFKKLGYNELLVDARQIGISSVLEAKAYTTQVRAREHLYAAEELYNDIGRLKSGTDLNGLPLLMADLTDCVDNYTDYDVQTVELLSEALTHAVHALLRRSWQDQDHARDKFGNELMSPKITITISCDPSLDRQPTYTFESAPGMTFAPNIEIKIDDVKEPA